jgi:hypothetical protein
MMAAAATVHVAVAMPMSLDLDHAVIVNGKRCHAEPCGGGRHDGENRRDRGDGDEQGALHDFLQAAGWRLIDTIPIVELFQRCTNRSCQIENFEGKCRFIPLARGYQPAGNSGRKPNISWLGCS